MIRGFEYTVQLYTTTLQHIYLSVVNGQKHTLTINYLLSNKSL